MTLGPSKARRIAQALPGLVVLALIVWGLYAVTKGPIGAITEDIAAPVAVVGSVISLAVGKAYEARAARRNDLRPKKSLGQGHVSVRSPDAPMRRPPTSRCKPTAFGGG